MRNFRFIMFIFIISGFLISVIDTPRAQVSESVTTASSASIMANQITVDTTLGGILIRTANHSRRSIIIRNQGGTDAYIGPHGLTIATGLLVKAGESVSLDRSTSAIYGIVAAGSTTMAYLEE